MSNERLAVVGGGALSRFNVEGFLPRLEPSVVLPVLAEDEAVELIAAAGRRTGRVGDLGRGLTKPPVVIVSPGFKCSALPAWFGSWEGFCADVVDSRFDAVVLVASDARPDFCGVVFCFAPAACAWAADLVTAAGLFGDPLTAGFTVPAELGVLGVRGMVGEPVLGFDVVDILDGFLFNSVAVESFGVFVFAGRAASCFL